jgi:lipopolysaccharide transport system ATP-binding protein
MSNDFAMKVEGIGKEFQLGHVAGDFNRNLRETLMALPSRMFQAISGKKQERHSTASNHSFWALRDISFTVRPGENIGLIGRNGAGKSTLLKVLSRVTSPTCGRAVINGRVGALLEVGTGMHLELTGRENVYLQGVILGMRRQEIERRFDEIIDFAEIEEFLDTPVKRYSSGMRVRLGFAVAAHLTPEILIVDEVLAVGDLAFQRKCFGKMKEVNDAGRTIILVSHNMSTINTLCSRSMLLDKGQIVAEGPTAEVTQHYQMLSEQSAAEGGSEPGMWQRENLPDADIVIHRVETLAPATGARKPTLAVNEPVTFRLHYRAKASRENASFGLRIRNDAGAIVIYYFSNYDSFDVIPELGEGYVDCSFPHLSLTSGRYVIDVFVTEHRRGWIYQGEDYGVLDIQDNPDIPMRSPYTTKRCNVYLPHSWSHS